VRWASWRDNKANERKKERARRGGKATKEEMTKQNDKPKENDKPREKDTPKEKDKRKEKKKATIANIANIARFPCGHLVCSTCAFLCVSELQTMRPSLAIGCCATCKVKTIACFRGYGFLSKVCDCVSQFR